VTVAPVSVVKVGGSLFNWPELPARLNAFLSASSLHRRQEHTVLIAGGAAAADFVRLIDRIHGIGDERAHRLALHALDLNANLLAAVLREKCVVVDSLAALPAAWSDQSIPVLAPRRFMTEIDRQGADPLPESWDVTSDTIAARLAAHLRAHCLVLLKSAPLPPGATRRDAARLGLVDPIFPRAAEALSRVEYLNLRDGSLNSRPLFP
jgi:5-(aminomethyl)-3-furanmethanol phosphate kinase